MPVFVVRGTGARNRNNGAVPYGEAWVPGDVIGCCIDLDKGEISFARNGKMLGVASSQVVTGPGWAYFPSLSLSQTERCRLNFGGTPFNYPIPGFQSLQPPAASLGRAKYLTKCWEDVIHMTASRAADNSCLVVGTGGAELPAFWKGKEFVLQLTCCIHVFEHLGPLLQIPSVVALELIPLFKRLDAAEDTGLLAAAIDLMAACTEACMVRRALEVSLMYLAEQCECVTPWNGSLASLRLAWSLLQLDAVSDIFVTLERSSIDKIMAGLFTIKLSGHDDMETVMPHVWWKDAPEVRVGMQCLATSAPFECL